MRPTLGFRIRGRVYSGGYDFKVHRHQRFVSDNSHSNTPQFKPPQIDVISTGLQSQGTLSYERTA